MSRRVTVPDDVTSSFVRAAIAWARVYASGDLSRLGEANRRHDEMQREAVAMLRKGDAPESLIRLAGDPK